MTCRVSRQDARAWPAAAVEVATQDRVSEWEHEITRLRAQLASERALSDGLRERVSLLEDQAGGYQVALAEAVVERDRARRDVEQLAAELGDAVAAGARAEDERDELRAEVEELRADVELWHEAAIQWMRTVGQLQAELETALRRERADNAAQARALRVVDEEGAP